jgi:hypothetical protein
MYSEEIIQGVKDHAMAHYSDGGWDVIVECYEDSELNELIETMADGAVVLNAENAIAHIQPIVDVWADRQADAEHHRREALGEEA